MAWSKKSPEKHKGERVVRRKQLDGTIKEYRYPKYVPRSRAGIETLEKLIDAYKDSPEWLALSRQTQAGRRTYLKPLVEIGTLVALKVARRDIIAIHDVLKVHHGNGAANAFLAATTALFRWAVRKDRIPLSPVRDIDKAPMGHHRAWTAAEADAAERGLPEHLRRATVLARHTGQRRGDLCAMTWAAYDGRSIRVTQQKTKPGEELVRLVIPCTPMLKADLDRWKEKATAMTILTNYAGKPWKPVSLSQVLPFALAKIGLASDLSIHGLRKLAAAELANAGCTPHEIMAITGHKTLAMIAHYTRSVDQERLGEAAITRLSDVRKGRKV